MAFWRKKMPKKYLVENLPKNAEGETMFATFLSNPNNPSLRLRLEPIEEEVDHRTGNIKEVKDSGCEVRFSMHRFQTGNRELMEMLLSHRGFNRSTHGFRIDHHDPTGLWRSLGYVESVPVQTFKVVEKGVVQVDEIKKRMKALEKEPPTKPETLVGLAE